MAGTQVIQIKHRLTGAVGAPGSLAAGEMAYNSVDKTLYYGDGDNGNGIATTIIKLAGQGAYLLAALLGTANGVASLDSTGKLPVAQLPAAVTGAMVYQGTWNAATNSPSLISGQGTKGQYYKVSTAGTVITTSLSGAAAAGATTVSVNSATGLAVGMLFANAAAAAGTTITAISGTTITLSAGLSSALASGAAAVFQSYLDGQTRFNVGDMVVFDGVTWDLIDGPAEAVTSVAGRIGAVVLTSADITDASLVGKSLLTAVSLAAQRAALRIDSRTPVNDAAYAMASTDFNVQYTSITAARIVTLPAANSVNPGAEFIIGDTSGQCSSTNTITAQTQGSDTLNGASAVTLGSAYCQVMLISDGTSKWTITGNTTPQSASVNGGTY